MQHRTQTDLEQAPFSNSVAVMKTPNGILHGAGTTVGNGIEGWAPGAIFSDTNSTTAGAQLYVNEGTISTALWKRIEAGDINILADQVIDVDAAGMIDFADLGILRIGTGADVQVVWNASYLEFAPATGFWKDCPLVGYCNGHTLAYEFFEDFMTLVQGDTTGWTSDSTNGTLALGAAETANTPGLGGYVTMNCPGTAEDWISLKPSSTDVASGPFKLTKDSGKKLWYEARVMISSVSDVSIYVGLADGTCTEVGDDDTGAENFGAAQDFVGFRVKNDAPTEIDQITSQNGTEVEVKANGATLAANTAITLQLYFDGVSTVTWYVNGAALADTRETDDTSFPDDSSLMPFFYIKEGAGASKSLHVDWVKVVQLR